MGGKADEWRVVSEGEQGLTQGLSRWSEEEAKKEVNLIRNSCGFIMKKGKGNSGLLLL
jgi:hypothetical protein